MSQLYNDNDAVCEIVNDMKLVSITDSVSHERNNNRDMIDYIINQKIDESIKQLVIYLIENDSYENYVDIYNICVENNIDLPPI